MDFPSGDRYVGCRWLSPRRAAVYLSVSVGTVYAWIRDGVIPAARICRRNARGVGRHAVTIRVDRVELDRRLKERSG